MSDYRAFDQKAKELGYWQVRCDGIAYLCASEEGAAQLVSALRADGFVALYESPDIWPAREV